MDNLETGRFGVLVGVGDFPPGCQRGRVEGAPRSARCCLDGTMARGGDLEHRCLLGRGCVPAGRANWLDAGSEGRGQVFMAPVGVGLLAMSCHRCRWDLNRPGCMGAILGIAGVIGVVAAIFSASVRQ
jgi:hypothetical protein